MSFGHCLDSARSKAQVDLEKLKTCVKGSAVNGGKLEADDNTLLRAEWEEYSNTGAPLIPTVIVNKVAYKGNLKSEYIFDALCSNFKNKPQVCLDPVEKPLVIVKY